MRREELDLLRGHTRAREGWLDNLTRAIGGLDERTERTPQVTAVEDDPIATILIGLPIESRCATLISGKSK